MPRRGLDAATVIAAAITVADSEGLAAVSVAGVAADLGVRGPSIYNHVAGRDGLVRGIALDGMRDLTARIREAAAGRSGADALMSAAIAYRGFARERPGTYDSLQRAPKDDPERQAAAAELVDALGCVLRAWDLEGDDQVHAIRVARSALHGFVELERLGGFDLDADPDETFKRIVLTFGGGLA
jgi:AcrR family transcriptional regulator